MNHRLLFLLFIPTLLFCSAPAPPAKQGNRLFVLSNIACKLSLWCTQKKGDPTGEIKALSPEPGARISLDLETKDSLYLLGISALPGRNIVTEFQQGCEDTSLYEYGTVLQPPLELKEDVVLCLNEHFKVCGYSPEKGVYSSHIIEVTLTKTGDPTQKGGLLFKQELPLKQKILPKASSAEAKK